MKDGLPAKQKASARFALDHPVQVSLASASLLAGWASLIVGDVRAVVGSGVAAFLLQFGLWNRRGPLRRRENRLYDSDGNLRP
jgi:hypothetical protein